MLWDEFYNGHFDWADSTIRTRISSLEDIGTGEDIVEVAQNIEDVKVRNALIRKAMSLGAVFTRDDYCWLEGEISTELFAVLGAYAGFDPNDPDGSLAQMRLEEEAEALAYEQAEAYWDQVDTQLDDYIAETAKPRRRYGLGYFLMAIFCAFAGRSHKTGQPNCNNRPPHYGYRYGRWYYGKGHTRGCEPSRKGRE